MNNYVIKPEEIGALHNLLNFQSTYNRVKIVNIGCDIYLEDIERLANMSANFKNPIIQGWIDAFYQNLIEKSNLDKMYVAFRYWKFCNDKSNKPKYSIINTGNSFSDWWPYFMKEKRKPQFEAPRDTLLFPEITAPKVWKDKNKELQSSWANFPPPDIIFNAAWANDYHEAVDRQKGNVDRLWNNAKQSIQNNKQLWNKQPEVLLEMKKYDLDKELTASDYFFFFHVLVGLIITNDITPQIQSLVFKTGSSEEYNDTFLNHLLFLVVLFLANPKGEYKFSNTQLVFFLQIIQGFMGSNTKLDEAMKTGLQINLNRLYTDDHYPYAGDNYENRMAGTVNVLNAIKLPPPPQ